MFGWFYQEKAKAVMRTKIVATYLDNYIRLNNGSEHDDWGNDWKSKSFNDVLKFYRDNEKNLRFHSKFGFVPLRMSALVDDPDNLFIYDALTVLFDIYFEQRPTIKELDALRTEFKSEKNIRGLIIQE